MKFVLSFFLVLSLVHQASARQIVLAPFKDKLFTYPRVIETSKDNSYWVVEYNRDRDLVGRDQILRRKAHFRYVDQGVRWSRGVRSFRSPNGTFKYFAVGRTGPQTAVAVIYVHGKGGNRRQGVNDWTFGGNFNRLQNLMVRNNGALFTPDFTDFKERGTADISALINVVKRQSPNANVIVACGSMGGGVCWRLANQKSSASRIDGLFILGSHWSDAFLKSQAIKRSTASIPIYIGHGSKDPVFDPTVQRSFYRQIKNSK